MGWSVGRLLHYSLAPQGPGCWLCIVGPSVLFSSAKVLFGRYFPSVKVPVGQYYSSIRLVFRGLKCCTVAISGRLVDRLVDCPSANTVLARCCLLVRRCVAC